MHSTNSRKVHLIWMFHSFRNLRAFEWAGASEKRRSCPLKLNSIKSQHETEPVYSCYVTNINAFSRIQMNMAMRCYRYMASVCLVHFASKNYFAVINVNRYVNFRFIHICVCCCASVCVFSFSVMVSKSMT